MTYQDILDDSNVDIVAIGDYFGIRGEMVMSALQSGKHVICDKPICTNLHELDVIESLALENGLEKWYTDAEEMLKSEKIDVCCILTPSGLHCECACLVASYGVNVLCEKSLEVTKEIMQKLSIVAKKTM